MEVRREGWREGGGRAKGRSRPINRGYTEGNTVGRPSVGSFTDSPRMHAAFSLPLT